MENKIKTPIQNKLDIRKNKKDIKDIIYGTKINNKRNM